MSNVLLDAKLNQASYENAIQFIYFAAFDGTNNERGEQVERWGEV